MAYVEPQTVLAPRASVRQVEVLYNEGVGEWSVARVIWEEEERLGIRWNGGEGPGVGNPQSRGKATWFIVPEALEGAVLKSVEELSLSASNGIIGQYREMAMDKDRERDAEEWTEGLISDASTQR